MISGKRHPSASDPVLSFIPDIYQEPHDFVIQIMDDFIAILFHTPFGSWSDELFIWNWKTARLLTVRFSISSHTDTNTQFSHRT